MNSNSVGTHTKRVKHRSNSKAALRTAAVLAFFSTLALAGCNNAPKAAPPQMHAMPVQVAPVALSPVASGDTYVATIKSRRSATMQPQVDGNLTKILVHSGDSVKAGQLLMQIDPLKQVAAVQQQAGTQAQSKALFQFNQGELARQKGLFDAGIISKQAFDTATQNFQNSKAALQAQSAGTATQRQQLAYYQIRAPFAGIVGDIPVHLGDYVSPTTMLTTVDENSGLEAYIYVPTERASEVRQGLPVEILDSADHVISHSKISFLSPQVDNGLQGILAKADIPASSHLRNLQVVNARVIWSTQPKPTVPVLAVQRIGGESFVYVAQAAGQGFTAHLIPVQLGQAEGNIYPVLGGLQPGQKVIVSGLQFIGEGAPVQPLEGGPPPPPAKV